MGRMLFVCDQVSLAQSDSPGLLNNSLIYVFKTIRHANITRCSRSKSRSTKKFANLEGRILTENFNSGSLARIDRAAAVNP
jgi:hypothetical protein